LSITNNASQEHGVEKLFQLEDRLETELATVTYFLRPEIEAVKKLVSHVRWVARRRR
jgi:hypothetical protein